MLSKFFVAFLCCDCFLEFSVGVRAFVIRLSQISSSFSLWTLGHKAHGNEYDINQHSGIIPRNACVACET